MTSPLRGITSWGENIGHILANGIREGIRIQQPQAQRAAVELANALAPRRAEMPQDAAATGATSDADSTTKGDQTSDAGTTGDDSQPDVSKIVAARVAQTLGKYGDLKELARKAAEYDKQKAESQTETERLQARIAELEAKDTQRETERKQERVQSATVREAARLGFRDPADAYRLLDTADIEFADDQPANLPKLLATLLKDKPYLSGAAVNGSADGGQQGKSTEGSKPSMNELIRAAAKGG